MRRSRNAVENLARAQHRLRLRLLEQTAGFDISQTLIEYSAQTGDLRPRLLGRPAQYAAGRGARHRASRRSSASSSASRGCRRTGWWRKLAAGYVEIDPQRAAAAATAVLVQRRAQGAAGAARQLDASGRHLPQQSRPVPAAADLRSRLRRWSCWRFVVGDRRRDRLRASGRASGRSAPASSRRCAGRARR